MAGWEDYFARRRWRVATELQGTDCDAGPEVHFDHGMFIIAPPGKFHSPLSSARGSKGYVLQEVTAVDGRDVPGSRIAVGVVVYRKAKGEGAIR